MVVAHNLAAMNSSRNLFAVSGKKAKSTEKLSTGYRINRASDDAAGLSISEKMRSLIRGLQQASDNIQDGISLVQTADGALGEVQDIIHRIMELSVTAANDTNTMTDREAIQVEIDELIEEVDRIAFNTEFNSIKLLDGSLSDNNHIFGKGIQSRDNISPDDEEIDNLSSSAFFSFSTTQVPVGGDTTVGRENLADSLQNQIVPQIVTSILDKYSAFSYLNGSTIGIGLRLYKKDNNTLAYVSAGYQEKDDGVSKGMKEYQLGVNLNHLSFAADGSLTAQSREELEATIAHEMMHAFMAEATTNGMLGKDRFPLWFVEGMAQTASGSGGWLSSLSPTSSDGAIRNILSRIGPGYSSSDGLANYGTGYLANMYLGYMAGTGGSLEARITDGLNKIMTTVINGSSLDDAIAQHTKYDGLFDFSNKVKDDTEAYDFVRNLLNQTGSGRGGLVAGNLAATDLASDANASNSVFQLYPNKEKVQNIYSGDYVILSGGGARNPTPPPGTSSSGGLPSVDGRDLYIQSGALAGDTIKLSIEGATAGDLGLQYISVTTRESAEWALESCQFALDRVSQNRANIGAYQNRLEHTIFNVDNTAENTQAAESRIRDTDIAKEMLSYSRHNILSEATQSFLTQANRSTQSVLTLLSQ